MAENIEKNLTKQENEYIEKINKQFEPDETLYDFMLK